MKKILISTLTIFLSLFAESKAQNYNDIYETYAPNEEYKRNTLPTSNESSTSINNQSKIKTSVESTEAEEVPPIRKKSKSRTVGNYLGIDFINTSLSYRKIEYNPNKVSNYTLPKHKNSFGLKYFYAINYNRFFLAPELFFEYNNIKKHFDGYNANVGSTNERRFENLGYEFIKIRKIYGGKINFGYDATPNFSPFLFAGLSKIYYSQLSSVYAYSLRNDIIKTTGKDSFSIMHKSKNVPFFGFGSKIKLSNHFSINAEYLIYNNFITKTSAYKNKNYIAPAKVVNSDFAEFSNKLRIIKLGLLYNF